jgi:hypothetical protein
MQGSHEVAAEMNDIKNISLNTKQERESYRDLVSKLIEISVSGLEYMYDSHSRLFCFRVRKEGGRIIQEGTSVRYTIISLLGLFKLKRRNVQIPIEVDNVLDNVLRNVSSINSLGDIGLLLWLCSLERPDRIDTLELLADTASSRSISKDEQYGKTTELSWYLAGLSHMALVFSKRKEHIEKRARQIYQLLLNNYGNQGIFGNRSQSSLSGRIRGRIGCFADQVYPVYALCMYGKAFLDQQAIHTALDCGKAICRLQGPLGQWWWHYDSQTGQVLGRYPVFSVHQDGMAPMALFELNETTGCDVDTNIFEGLQWITGRNELGANMVDVSYPVIWRNISTSKANRYFEIAMHTMHAGSRSEVNASHLSLLYESRPYHLGWVLYAFAGRVL